MNIALIKAGGVGARMNAGIPKQFIQVNGIPIIIYTLEAFEKHPLIDEIVIVCVEEWIDRLWEYIREYDIKKVGAVVSGGETSLKSIKNGVEALAKNHDDTDMILIHDANRPLVSEDIITDVIEKSNKYGNAVAAIQCTDEVMVSDNTIDSDRYLDRKSLFRIQTPDAYSLKYIHQLMDSASEAELTNIGSTNTLVISRSGVMHFAKGSELNIRLTRIEDINLFKGILNIKSEEILNEQG